MDTPDANMPPSEKVNMFGGKLHEIGHALGLREHSPNATDVMFQSWLRNTLSDRDKATIARLYKEGEEEDAHDLLSKMSQQGNSYALCAMGRIYRDGIGVKRNSQLARTFYEKASKNGLVDADIDLGYLYKKAGTNLPQNYEEAFACFSRAAQTNNSVAKTALGYMYAHGQGTSKDIGRAFALYSQAAAAGNTDAQCWLGYAYRNGVGTAKDDYKAFDWYQKSADAHDVPAMAMLGQAYREGRGVGRDSEKAFYWYKRAALVDDEWSQGMLGYCYEKGIGVPKDQDKAELWYRRASARGDEHAHEALKRLHIAAPFKTQAKDD
jgi:TPR repeat protein